MSTSMETHYPHDPVYAPPPSYALHSDQYLATAGDLEFAANFSLGSSLAYPDPHEGYPYVFHRGEGSSYREGTTTAGLAATGLGFSDNNTPSLTASLFPNEEVPLYSQSWSWTQQTQASTLHGVVAPVPVLPGPPEVSFLPLKNKQVPSQSSYDRPPDPPLPTPAAMAVLLSSGGRADNRGPFDLVEGVAAAPNGPTSVGVGVPANHGTLETTSREKKHACTMCHKRFDRPSTLRKHLLVHTGEKAFVCDICGRRFGVNSNLNRHVKRCALKPVNMAISSPPKSSSDSPSSCDETSGQASPVAQSPENSFLARSPTISHKRGSVSSMSSSSSSPRGRSSMSPLQSQHHPIPTNTGTKQLAQKRRRRAPSPSRWVPLSLRSFNLVSEDMYRSVSVPLVPVRRNLPKEERDSWDENIAPTPYHPDGWKGVLPGPGLPTHHGLRGKDMTKMHYGGGAGTFMVGRLLSV